MVERQKKVRVAILYRVKQHWRLPIFERLSEDPRFDLRVFHGPSFEGTKVVNSLSEHKFSSTQMWSFRVRLKTSNGDAFAPLSPFLFFELIRFKPDVILCEGASNLLNNCSAYLYAWLFNARTVQWGLGELERRRKSKLRQIMDGLIHRIEKSSTACLAYSSLGAAYYRSLGIRTEKVFVAVNVVDTNAVIERVNRTYDRNSVQNNRGTDFRLLFVGALTSPKKVDLLLRAYRIASNRTSKSLSLIIVGDGPIKAELENLSLELGLNDVFFEGQVIDGVSQYFLESDLFVLPGLGGLAVSEALAHGLPVVCGVGDGCEIDLLSYGAGIRDADLDEISLADHINRLVENENELAAMKAAALKTIRDIHNIDSYIRSVIDCIEYAISAEA